MTGIGSDLTKYPYPLIMIARVEDGWLTGDRRLPTSTAMNKGGLAMRVMVSKVEGGKTNYLILPGHSKRLPPVYIKDVKRDERVARLLPTLEAAERGKVEVAVEQLF